MKVLAVARSLQWNVSAWPEPKQEPTVGTSAFEVKPETDLHSLDNRL